jgi:hypothetical protein
LNLKEHSLKVLTDIQEIDKMKANAGLSGGSHNYVKTLSENALGRLQIEQEYNIATTINTIGNYTLGNTTSITTKWGNSSADILGDIDTAMQKVFELTGNMPNTITMSQKVWKTVKRNSVILGLLSTTSSKIMTTEIFGSFLDIGTVLIGTASYKASPDATSMTAVWADNCLVSYNDVNSVNMEPTFGVTATHKDYTSPINEVGQYYSNTTQ